MRDEAARHHDAAGVALLELGEPGAQRARAGVGGTAAIDEDEHTTVADDARPARERRGIGTDADHGGKRGIRDRREVESERIAMLLRGARQQLTTGTLALRGERRGDLQQ